MRNTTILDCKFKKSETSYELRKSYFNKAVILFYFQLRPLKYRSLLLRFVYLNLYKHKGSYIQL